MRHHDQGVGKNADHDGRHAVQQVRGIADEERHRSPAEFRQVHAAQQADGNPKQRGKQQELQAAHDGIGHSSTGFAHRDGKLGKEIPGKILSAVPDQIAENKKERRYCDQRAQARERQHHHVQRFAPHQAKAHEGSTPLPRAVVTRISRRARPFSTNVSRNSTRPSSINALKYKLPVASENSLASTAAIE